MQLCGDAHVSNFGLFASPERNLVFDINDFDETLPGPWEWDVKRLVASVALVAQENGFGRDERERVVRTCAHAYRDRMRTLATMRELDVWYAHTVVDDAVEAEVDHTYAQTIRRTAAKAHTRDNLEALSKLTRVVDGRRRLASDPPLLIPIDELVGDAQARRYEQQMSVLIDEYQQSLDPSRRWLMGRFRYVGGARKVVGVGSVGTRAWVVLLLGRDDSDPLLMQVKEAEPSVLEPYLGSSGYTNGAERVVRGSTVDAIQQRHLARLAALRQAPTATRATITYANSAIGRTSIAPESMTPQLLANYGQSCAHVLARAHARTGDRIAIAGYLGSGDVADIAFTRFAEAYARQNERDYATLREAVASGRVTAEPDL